MLRIVLILWVMLCPATAFSADRLRIGAQATGTFAWQMDVIRRHGLDRAAGLDLSIIELASPDAGKLALNGGAVDLAVVDWLWVARERALGAKLQFYPYSSAVGAIMTKNQSPVRSLADLKGRVLSIAGGPLDKSWLIVRAAAKLDGIDVKNEATLQYGAPPLIFEKLIQGEADASLNFWNFTARLEARGYRRLLDVRDAQAKLGLKEPIAMIGYAFSETFVAKHRSVIDRFLGAVQKANDLLLRSDAEWETLRPLMRAEDEATFTAYRTRTRERLPSRSVDAEEADARTLFSALATIGGPELVGPARELDPGLYYRPAPGGN